MKKYNILIILNHFFILFFLFSAQAQTRVNKEWETSTGNPIGLQWSSSIMNVDNQVISIGNSLVANQGANVLLTTYNPDGSLAWQRDFNTSGANNDYGISITTDAAKNIYVCGTTDNGVANNNDILLLKYAANGTLIWSTQYNSTFNKHDIGTALKVDATGNIFVVARSESSTNNQDFLTLKFNSLGTVIWTSRYDFSGLSDIPIGVELDTNGNIQVIGASGSSFNNWDFVLVNYDPAGNQLSVVRNIIQGIGFDLPTAFQKDILGNIYITGKGSSDGLNYDIKTVKITPSLSIAWTRSFDGFGNDDAANALYIDQTGNVIIGGYITNANSIKEQKVIKYDAQGNQIWTYEQEASDNTGGAETKDLQIGSNGQIYCIAEEKGYTGTQDIVVYRLDDLGTKNWQKTIASSANDKSTELNIAADGNIYVSAIKEASANTYTVTKYRESEINFDVVTDSSGNPLYRAHQLVVRFKRSAINKNMIDGNTGTSEIEFADLGDFLLPQAKYQVDTALGLLCAGYPCPIITSKIFKQLKTTDISTISHLGTTIPIPDFWTTLLLEFPTNIDITQVMNRLKTIPKVVSYSEYNYILSLDDSAKEDTPLLPSIAPLLPTGANDAHYDKQASIHQIVAEPLDVNVEDAWDLNTGLSKIKGGVFDSGIDYLHEDFDFGGNSIVESGWDFIRGNGSSWLKSRKDGDDHGHGTSCAGIIGAVRNNNKGIAGIAGGNTESKGVKLYSLKILEASNGLSSIDNAYDAIVTSAVFDPLSVSSPQTNYGYGLHFMSNSWGISRGDIFYHPNNIQTLREAVHFANRKNITFIASRGNSTLLAPLNATDLRYPATFTDDWVINVGGSNEFGQYNGGLSYSLYGNDVDVAAPAISLTTIKPSIIATYTTKNNGGYTSFNGTSAAAPHVSGAVGLMMSYINPTGSPSPDNLAPEDCEHIIELSANQLESPGIPYNPKVGWGRLNIGKSMQLIDKQYNKVRHFGTQTVTITAMGTETIGLTERCENKQGQWFEIDKYKVKIFKIEATNNHTLGTNDRVVSYWARNSASNLFPLFDSNTKELASNEKMTINSCSTTSCSMTGYVYEMSDMNGNVLGFLPVDPNVPDDVTFEYTVLTSNKPVTATEKVITTTDNIKLYPNPTESEQIISIITENSTHLSIKVFDIAGRLLQSVYDGEVPEGENQLKNDISTLAQGVYIYEIKLGNSYFYKKLLKQ